MNKQINKIIGVAYVERKARSLFTYVRPTSLEAWKCQVVGVKQSQVPVQIARYPQAQTTQRKLLRAI